MQVDRFDLQLPPRRSRWGFQKSGGREQDKIILVYNAFGNTLTGQYYDIPHQRCEAGGTGQLSKGNAAQGTSSEAIGVRFWGIP